MKENRQRRPRKVREFGCVLSPEDSDLLDRHANLLHGYLMVYEPATKRTTGIHRIVMFRTSGRWSSQEQPCDHVNRDKLDNRRENLRIVSRKQNALNKSHRRKYRGSYFVGGFWEATILVDGKKKSLGRFKTEVEAAMAFNNAAKVVYGEFAVLNDVPDGVPTPICMFKSRYVYVSFCTSLGKWMAGGRVNGKRKHLGYFNTEMEAAKAVKKVMGRLRMRCIVRFALVAFALLTGCATPRSELAVEYRVAETSELVVLGKIEVNP